MNLDNLICHPTGDAFTGIRISNKQIDFYYPETFRLSSKDDVHLLRSDIIAILTSIGLAKSVEAPTNEIESSFGNQDVLSIVSYLWIINDYYKNGIWSNKVKVYRNGQCGKINWKRTMQQTPFVSNGSIIYPDSVIERKATVDDIFSEIHRCCVKISIDFLGWLYNIRADFAVPEITETSKKMYSYILHRELGNTFQDEKRTRLSHMLKIVEGINTDNQAKEIVYGVSTYHYVFEQMVNTVFGNQADLSQFYPKAYWMIDDTTEKESSSLRPDTVRIEGEKAYIIDSKYYTYGKLPTTSDIQKQITYAEYLDVQHGSKFKPIKNAFILPFDKRQLANNSFDSIKYIGYARTNWENSHDGNTKPHYVIYGYYIDTTELIHRYRSGWDDAVKQLLSELNAKDAKIT